MSRCALLCLALFVGSVSAWGNWFSKNRHTECGNFKTLRQGWFSQDAKTDVDTQKMLDAIVIFDTNHDGFVTFAESTNQSVMRSLDQSLDLNAGIPRCTFVQFETKRYGINKEVSSAIFDLGDINNDLLLTNQDITVSNFNQQDENGDGQVSVCERFRSFMKILQIAEHKVYMKELRYTNLVFKSRKASYWNFLKW